jgi:hypothetical protein
MRNRCRWYRRAPSVASIAATLLLLPAGAGVSLSAQEPGGGDRILAQAVAAPGLTSYVVPVHFNVHLHKPIGIRTNADGEAYYRAPSQSALLIRHARGLLGGFFRGTYKLDLVPQAWPYSYHVTRVVHAVANGNAVVELHAQTRSATPNLSDVIFTLDTPALHPVAAAWQYSDGSSIHLTYVNGTVQQYELPQQATIAVNMRREDLDATAIYGRYDLNADIKDDVFRNAR